MKKNTLNTLFHHFWLLFKCKYFILNILWQQNFNIKFKNSIPGDLSAVTFTTAHTLGMTGVEDVA